MSRFLNCMWDILAIIFNDRRVMGVVLIFAGISTAMIDYEPGRYDISAFICVFLPLGLLLIFAKEDPRIYKE